MPEHSLYTLLTRNSFRSLNEVRESYKGRLKCGKIEDGEAVMLELMKIQY